MKKCYFAMLVGILLTACKPYSNQEITIEVSDEIRLGGTLSVPAGKGPFPAVIFISGSGPQDRDENFNGFRIFADIARHLNLKGIATLRCDDRGVGATVGGDPFNYTFDDVADDVGAQIDFLRSRPEIDNAEIGLLGHSEGGTVAVMVAAQSEDVAFVVSMTGPAVSWQDILYAQREIMLGDDSPLAEGDLEREMYADDEIFTALLTGEGLQQVKPRFRELLMAEMEKIPAEQRSRMGNIERMVDAEVDGQFALLEGEWLQFFRTYDPAVDLERITCPFLGLYGELDLQNPAQLNVQGVKQAFQQVGKSDYKVIIVPQANHLFQKALTGTISERSQLAPEFVPGFVDTISRWVLVQTGG